MLLDEVGDTTPEIQSKLLRVLESGRFRRVGGTQEIAVDVRIISATNRNLRAAVARGRFREDLYFRLAPLMIDVPPLRERVQDIPLLIEHYVRRLNRRFSTSVQLSPAAVEELCARPWPGNVRELIHVLEQVIVLCEHETVEPEHLPRAAHPEGPARRDRQQAGPILPLHEVQRRHILDAVEQAGGNRAKAARMLEISERNLYRLLDKYGWRAPASSTGNEDGPTS